ncbi:MAG: COG1361 S-layer family protein [Conexivisphaera sp.]
MRISLRALLASVLAAALLASAALPAAAQLPTTVPPVVLSYYGWGTPSSPLYPSPGAGQVPFTVEVVANPAEDGAPTVVNYATLNLTGTPLTNSSGGLLATAAPAQVSSGAYYLTFYLQVPPTALPGTYTAALDVYYSQTRTTSSSSGVTTTVDYYVYAENVTATIYRRPSVTVLVSAPAIYAGQTGSLVVAVENGGDSTISDLSVAVQSSLPLVGGNSSSLAELAPGSSADFSFSVLAPQAPGYYPVQVIVGYRYGGIQYSSAYYANADVISPVGSLYAYATPSTIPYQRNDTVTVHVVNGLSGPVSDVVVSVEPSQYLFVAQGYGQFRLGSMAPGASSAITLSVIPLASSPGPSLIELQASYVDPGGVQRQTVLTVPIYLEGLAAVSFSQVSVSGALYPGAPVTVSGMLLNTGTDEAYYGSLYVNGSVVQGAQPEYIGNLPTNSPTPFSASFEVSPDAAPGFHTVSLVFSYQDELGHAYAVSYPLTVQVLSAPPAQPTGHARGRPTATYALAAAAAAIVAAVAVAMAVRRRGRPPA